MCAVFYVITCVAFQLWVVPTVGSCSHGSEADAADSVRALLSPAAEGSAAQSSGLHNRTPARSGRGFGGLRQVHILN